MNPAPRTRLGVTAFRTEHAINCPWSIARGALLGSLGFCLAGVDKAISSTGPASNRSCWVGQHRDASAHLAPSASPALWTMTRATASHTPAEQDPARSSTGGAVAAAAVRCEHRSAQTTLGLGRERPRATSGTVARIADFQLTGSLAYPTLDSLSLRCSRDEELRPTVNTVGLCEIFRKLQIRPTSRAYCWDELDFGHGESSSC